MQIDNETWLLDAADAIIRKRAAAGIDGLSQLEHLIYCLWVADYGMRNAGDLAAAGDLYAAFQFDGERCARDLGLPATTRAFALPSPQLQRDYLSLFDSVCDEIRQYA